MISTTTRNGLCALFRVTGCFHARMMANASCADLPLEAVHIVEWTEHLSTLSPPEPIGVVRDNRGASDHFPVWTLLE